MNACNLQFNSRKHATTTPTSNRMATYAETDEQIRIHVGWIPLAQPVLYFPLVPHHDGNARFRPRFGPMSFPRRANLPT